MRNAVDEPKIMVIGYGNSLRGDDGAGWVAAERLDDLLPEAQVRVLIRHQLTPELADPVSRMDLVVFMDASCVDPAGRLVCRPVEPTSQTDLSLLHEVDAAQLLGMALAVFGRCARGIMYSVGGENFEMGEHLTAKVQLGVDELVGRVEKLVRQVLAGDAAETLLAAEMADA